jgi:glutathione synthase/RimK-type ligase-like ATP-grasp enzyme
LVRRRDLKDLHTLRWSPVILQEYVPKHVELRVTVVGSEIFPAEIESQASSRSRDDWRRYDLARTPYRRHTLPADVAERLHAVVRAFGLCYGAIDLVLTPDGRYVFLEINGNGQWLWIEELTQMPIADAIASLLARRREATPVALPATDNWTDALRGGHAPDVLARV